MAGAAISKVAKMSARKLNRQFFILMLALVIIVAIICRLFWICAAVYLTKRASPEEVAALAAKNRGEDRENRRRKTVEEGDSGAIHVLNMEEGVLGQTTTEWEHDGQDKEDEFLP
jgi:hypothetical protein